MYVTNITDDYNDTLSLNNICTDNENNDIIIPALLFTIPSGISFLCLLSIIVYTLIKPLINNEWWRSFFIQIIQLSV